MLNNRKYIQRSADRLENFIKIDMPDLIVKNEIKILLRRLKEAGILRNPKLHN